MTVTLASYALAVWAPVIEAPSGDEHRMGSGGAYDGGRALRPAVVYEDGKYDGMTLREWMPVAVDDVVRALDPQRVILFGSVARGEAGPDSDLDLLVVLDEAPRDKKRALMIAAGAAITAPIPVDVLVTDPAELERRKDVIGSLYYWPAREGEVVYQRPA